MAGPWEKYQQPATQGAGPWLRYQPQQPAAVPSQSKTGGIVDAFTQGATMGFGDELTGVEAAILGRTPEGGWFDYSRPFSERYQRAVDAERGQQEAFRAENPVTATAANVAGAVATPVAAAGRGMTLMRGGMGTGQALARGGAEGAAYGAATAAGNADGGDRLESAIYGGALGAAIGAPVTAGVNAVANALAQSSARKAAPSLDALRRQADDAYATARAQNPQVPGFDRFAMSLYNDLPQAGFHPNLHPRVKVVLDRVEELSRNGTAPDLKTLEQLRRLARAPVEAATKDEQRLGKMIVSALDDYMENAPGVARGLDAMREGRQLYGRYKRGEQIAGAVTAAQDRAASTGSGGNFENALRQEVRKILSNPKKRAGYSAEEIEAMRAVVRGNPTQDALRLVGKLSPGGNGLMTVLTGVMPAAAAGSTGNPLFLAPMGAGMVAKALADRGTRVGVENLAAGVRSGTMGGFGQRALTPIEQAIAKALAAQGGQSIAP